MKWKWRWKAEAAQVDLCIITHIVPYSDVSRHNQAYPEPCVILANSERGYIQNAGIFRTRGIFKNLAYPEPWYFQNQRYIQNLRHIQHDYNEYENEIDKKGP